MNGQTTGCRTRRHAGAKGQEHALLCRDARRLASAVVGALLIASRAGAATPTDMRIRATSTSFSNGSNGRYTVTVSNRGRAATDAPIHVTDVLPDGFTFFSGTGRGWQCTASGQTVDCVHDDSVRAGSASSIRLLVSVCTTATALTNSITVVYPAETDPANNTMTRITRIKRGQPCAVSTAPPTATLSGPTGTPTPVTTGTATSTPAATSSMPAASTDLAMAKTISQPFTTGSTGVYTLTVTNVGAATTNATITVTDVVPDSLPLLSAAGTGWTCSHAGQAVTCTTEGPIAPTASSSITLTVLVSDAAYPTVTNTATLSYAGDTNPANDVAKRPTTIRLGDTPGPNTATPTQPVGTPPPSNTLTRTPTLTPTLTPGSAAATDLEIVKTTSSTFTVGSTATYLLTVSNLGAVSSNETITVVDSLPSGLSFVSASGGGWSCSASGQTVTCMSLGAVAPGALTGFTLVVSVGSAAYPTVTNTATLTYAGDTDLSNNVARKPTTVRQ
jgi:uncharacterized repeat protein (TIGR01451 family)